MDVPASFPITSKGQVTIPKALRQQLGLGRGSPVSFELVGDHIELRPCRPSPGHVLPTDGFGLLSRSRPPVPVDFDPAPACCNLTATDAGFASASQAQRRAIPVGARRQADWPQD